MYMVPLPKDETSWQVPLKDDTSWQQESNKDVALTKDGRYYRKMATRTKQNKR